MRRAEIEEQNRFLLERQRQFRVVTEAWMAFQEVQAIAVIGSVAGPLWKEVPRFREFRRRRIEFGTNAAILIWPSGSMRKIGSATCAALAALPCKGRMSPAPERAW